MCNHPQISWIGKSDGIWCGACGAKIDPFKTAPAGLEPIKKGRPAAEKVESDPEPVEEKTKKAPKKGGRK